MKLHEILQLSEGPMPDEWWIPKALTDDEIIAWCERNASEFLNNSQPIYRGINALNASGLLDTSNFKRESQATNDIYNKWIDNHSAWKNFPKRSKSLVCTTVEGYAQDYGKLYLMIPEDNAKVGICPSYDIWQSFKCKEISDRPLALDEFVNDLEHLGVDPTSWETIKATSEQITSLDDSNSPSFELIDSDLLDDLAGLLTKYKNLYKVLEYIFDPDENEFDFERASDYQVEKNTELWIYGRVIQIRVFTMSDKLKAFFSKFYDL